MRHIHKPDFKIVRDEPRGDIWKLHAAIWCALVASLILIGFVLLTGCEAKKDNSLLDACAYDCVQVHDCSDEMNRTPRSTIKQCIIGCVGLWEVLKETEPMLAAVRNCGGETSCNWTLCNQGDM